MSLETLISVEKRKASGNDRGNLGSGTRRNKG